MKKKKEDKPKAKYYYCEQHKVKKISIKPTQDDKVFRLKFECDNKDITCKIRRIITETSKDEIGITIEKLKTELYTKKELYDKFPIIVALAKNCVKSPQEITLSYRGIMGESQGEEKEFFFMNNGQFETIYYKPFHKDDKTNLEKQEAKKNKYAEIDMGLESENDDDFESDVEEESIEKDDKA